MPVQTIFIGGKPVLVEVQPTRAGDEVAPTPAKAVAAGKRGSVKMRNVSVRSDIADSAKLIEDTVAAVLDPVGQALKAVGPDEWTVELTLGFKGGAGIPFLVNGEANGSVKVSAKWKKQA